MKTAVVPTLTLASHMQKLQRESNPTGYDPIATLRSDLREFKIGHHGIFTQTVPLQSMTLSSDLVSDPTPSDRVH